MADYLSNIYCQQQGHLLGNPANHCVLNASWELTGLSETPVQILGTVADYGIFSV